MAISKKLTNIHINGKWYETLEGYYGGTGTEDRLLLKAIRGKNVYTTMKFIANMHGVTNIGALIEGDDSDNPVLEFRGKFLLEEYQPRRPDIEETLEFRAVAEPTRIRYGVPKIPKTAGIPESAPAPVSLADFLDQEEAKEADVRTLDTRNDPDDADSDGITSLALQSLNIEGVSLDSVQTVLRMFENSMDSAAGTPAIVLGRLLVSGKRGVHGGFLTSLSDMVRTNHQLFPDAEPRVFDIEARVASRPYKIYHLTAMLVNLEINDGDEGTHDTLTFEVLDYTTSHDKKWAPTTTVDLTLDDLSAITSALYLLQQSGGRDFSENELKRFEATREKLMNALHAMNE